MGDDIFGTIESEGVDTTDEGLADRWEEDTTQSEPQSAIEQELSDEADDDKADDGADSEGIALDGEEDNTSDPAGAEDIPDALLNKTPAELAKMVSDSQSELGRRSGEVGDLRKLIEQQQEQLQQLTSHLQSQSYQDDGIDTSGWEEDLRDNPQAVYQQALELLDNGQIDIGQMEEVLEAASEMHPRLGRAMSRDFDRRIVLAEVGQQMQPVQQEQSRNVIQSVVKELWNSPDANTAADIQEYNEEISRMFPNGQGLAGLPAEQVRAKLQQALVVVRGNDTTRSSQYKTALAALKADSTVEGGTPSAKESAKTEEDLMREAVFKQRKKDPSEALFASM